MAMAIANARATACAGGPPSASARAVATPMACCAVPPSAPTHNRRHPISPLHTGTYLEDVAVTSTGNRMTSSVLPGLASDTILCFKEDSFGGEVDFANLCARTTCHKECDISFIRAH